MNNNIISYKLTLLLIKYIPVIQMTGIFINRLLDYFTSLEIVDILDFIFGSTILATTLLISCSRTFKFCVFHRIIIMCNLVIQMLYIINNNKRLIDIIKIYLNKEIKNIIKTILYSLFVILLTLNHFLACSFVTKIKPT